MNRPETTIPSLVTVRGLEVELGRPRVRVVDCIDFSLQPGEITGLVGESGSGKSVTALALTRLLPPEGYPDCRGKVLMDGIGQNLLTMGERSLRKIRGSQIGYIFQEPSASFNPVCTIRSHMEEILRVHGIPRAQHPALIHKVMEDVGMAADPEHLEAWPADFSGGMLQRTAIACALLGSPRLLVADEPTTALDTSTQKRIINVFKRLNEHHKMAILFISHDLGLLKELATRILVMKEGKILEEGPVGEILKTPKHPYTQSLLDSLPKLRR